MIVWPLDTLPCLFISNVFDLIVFCIGAIIAKLGKYCEPDHKWGLLFADSLSTIYSPP